jgi:uncharacterized protein
VLIIIIGFFHSLPMNISQKIAQELTVQAWQVEAAIDLIDAGATIPFIARYRKERTGALDDTHLRFLQERLDYLRELEERREAVLNSIREQGKLTEALQNAILVADTKTRHSKAQIAREAGLAPLAQSLLQNPDQEPERAAAVYVNADKGVADVRAALDGARQILMEYFAEDAELLEKLRDYIWNHGFLQARVIEDKAREGAKFADYFDYSEALRKIPSHRALALFRGRNEGVLQLTLRVGESREPDRPDPCEMMIAHHVGIRDQGRPADVWLRDTVHWAWRVKLFTRLEGECKQRLREAAEEQAIQVFTHNLRDLLLAAPAGPRVTLGLDPGLRTGVKVAVVDATGKLLETTTLYPHDPHKRWDESIQILAQLARRHGVEIISIGNGTASRETDRLVRDLIKRHPELHLQKVMVSEAGASVYSASALAAQEFPELDVSLRGAVSIARRLQDPLAELVKIDPKSIGVGQYQHDVSQVRLARSVNAVVEDCVNAVGVDLNTASMPLLARVAGLNSGLARNIVEYRNNYGAFSARQQLLKVPRLGEKTFEQAVGFLRIINGTNPLDRSAVHPEAYPVVERILKVSGRSIDTVLGDIAFLDTLDPRKFTDQRFGLPTVEDILAELKKPGRDPRPEFRTAIFKEGVEGLADLKPGMLLEGVVTNVTHFGALVDIGVHHDGLVHISALADQFVRDPRDKVKVGDVVRVKVLEIDTDRKRIALTMRLGEDHRAFDSVPKDKIPLRTHREKAESRPAGALAEAFARAKRP